MLAQLITWVRSTWHTKYAVIVLSAAVGLGGYEAFDWAKMDASAWGTWVGSIGTVFTLVGTIWLATADMRRRRRSEIVLARLQSATMLSPVERATVILQNVEKFLIAAPDDDRTIPSVLARCHGYVDEIELWSVDQALPFASLRNRTADLIVESGAVLKILLSLLGTGVQYYETVEERATHVRMLSGIAADGGRLVKLLANELRDNMRQNIPH